MRKQLSTTGRPSKDQVKAWLATVVAPMVSALHVEVERLSIGNWSFRADLEDFDALWLTSKMVSAHFAPNVEQFFRYHPDILHGARNHDVDIEGLRAACRTAYQRLLDNNRFRVLVSEVV